MREVLLAGAAMVTFAAGAASAAEYGPDDIAELAALNHHQPDAFKLLIAGKAFFSGSGTVRMAKPEHWGAIVTMPGNGEVFCVGPSRGLKAGDHVQVSGLIAEAWTAAKVVAIDPEEPEVPLLNLVGASCSVVKKPHW